MRLDKALTKVELKSMLSIVGDKKFHPPFGVGWK